MAWTIGIDVGGTKIAAGVVDENGGLEREERRETPAQDPKATITEIVDLVRELSSDHDVEAVGIGAAGYIDAERSNIMFAPNLAWRDEPLRQEVESRIDVPVVVENDANAAAWGEFKFGAAKDVHDALMVAVGTGIGGGIVLDGELYRGRFGIAAEFGHMRVVPDGYLCGCSQHGCWEQYASGTSLIRIVRELADTGSPQATSLLARAGGEIGKIDGRLITEAAAEGDLLAKGAFDSVGRWLGEGLASLAAIFDPGVIVLGGGVSEAGEFLIEPTKDAFVRHISGRGFRPEAELRVAELANQAGLIGAADLARQR